MKPYPNCDVQGAGYPVAATHDGQTQQSQLIELRQQLGEKDAQIAALREAARLLLLELNDWTLGEAATAISNTNAAVIRLRRDQLSALLTAPEGTRP